MSGQRSAFRPDIEGLRGIAVLAVLVFHINPAWLPGGFVGVDMFFVVSGYLITGILRRELERGEFSLARFYERRVRRILPSLWLVIAFTLLAGYFILLAHDWVAMAKSAVWGVLAIANVFFWREVSSDYFAPDSAQMPLLHLWSLGVEEQFYVIWPLLLMGLAWLCARGQKRRLPGPRFAPVAAIVALLLVLVCTWVGEWLLRHDGQRFAYYMLPARAGELAIGAAWALWRGRAVRLSPVVGTSLLLGAWVALGYSLFAMSEHAPFPGLRSLLPTLATVVFIAVGEFLPQAAAAAPLRLSALQWVGRCSYAAYLWHWPLLAYWRYLWGEPSTAAGLGLLLLCLALAEGSRRLVEEPARRAAWSPARVFFLQGLLPMLALGGVAALMAKSEALGLHLHRAELRAHWQRLEAAAAPAHRMSWVCQSQRLAPDQLQREACAWGAPDQPGVRRALLLGDSHAAQFAPLLRELAAGEGLRVRSVAIGSCVPLPSGTDAFVAPARQADCAASMPAIWREADEYPLLFLGGNWASYVAQDGALWARLEALLRERVARGQSVVLLPRAPAFERLDTACPAKQVQVGKTWLECAAQQAALPEIDSTNARLRDLAARVPGVRFVDLGAALCQGAQSCRVLGDDGLSWYSDASHLSVEGSRQLALQLRAAGRSPGMLSGIPAP